MDTEVAQRLLRAAAAKLMSTDLVITGIGPRIAQTMVQLGIDLRAVTTRASLEDGLQFALNRLGYRITERDTDV